MILPPFESSHRDDSNDKYLISVASILTELARKEYLKILCDNLASGGWILMILPSSDSSHRDDSNDRCFIFVASILTELVHKEYLRIFKDFL